MMRTLFLISTLTACASTEAPDAKPTESEYTWPGGTFAVSTTSVVDDCMAGDAEDLFFDDDSPYPWEHPITIPSWEELADPEAASIELSEPFTSTEVTMRQGSADGQVVIRGIRQDAVVPDPEDEPDCVVDLVIDVLITLDAADNVRGTATITAEDRSGTNTCPEFVVPCDVAVEFAGLRTD